VLVGAIRGIGSPVSMMDTGLPRKGAGALQLARVNSHSWVHNASC
jgi:hypothetical protein